MSITGGRILRASGRIALVLFAYVAGVSAAAAQPTIDRVDINSQTIPRSAKLELTVALHAQFQNPYDPADVRLFADFTGPAGQQSRVDGFRYQPFNASSPTGSPVWKIRFSPTAAGAWSFRVTCTDRTGTALSSALTFSCTASDSHGFVSRTDAGSLLFDDGRIYFAAGENIGWWSSDPLGDYRHWIDRLSANGGNYIRIWMASWAFSPEWTDTGLGNYDNRQRQASYLDELVTYAELKGVYVQLCLINHGQFSISVNPDWAGNPYNAANGGPCRNPWEFFTDASAKELIKQRFRYIVARWSYSPNLLAWELFNEVDLTEQYSDRQSANADWHREMAAYLKEIDPQHHLVTTSYSSFPGDTNVWEDANVDYAQIHHYDTSDDQSYGLNALTQSLRASIDKPVFIGEFGFPDERFSLRNDPNGVNLHNSLWASAFSGAFGLASTWWWDNYIDPANLYHHFGPVSAAVGRAVAQGGPLVTSTPEVTTAERADLAIMPGLGSFVRPPESTFTVRSDATVTPSEASLSRFLFAAEYHPELFNPPTFVFDAPKAGQFRVRTGPEAGASPRIVIYLDGAKLLDKSARVSTVYEIDIPAGHHEVLVTNTGLDWITIDQFEIGGFVPAVRCVALQGPSMTAGWVANRGYTWRRVLGGNEPDAVTDATIKVRGLHDDSYLVEWRSCATGDVISRSQTQATQGIAVIAVPPVAWDLSFELRVLLPGSDIESPVVSELTVSKKKVKRAVDPTVDLTWHATDNIGVVTMSVQFASDGSSFVPVVENIPVDSTGVRWTVPASLPRAPHGAVRVVALDAAGNEGRSLPVGLKIK